MGTIEKHAYVVDWFMPKTFNSPKKENEKVTEEIPKEILAEVEEE